MKNTPYKLIFFIPTEHCEIVKEAIFATGAGTLGGYANCAWQTLGTGQFTPGDSTNPHIGSINQAETVAEYRVEILCSEQNIEAAVAALLQHHPYEKPAFEVYQPMSRFFD